MCFGWLIVWWLSIATALNPGTSRPPVFEGYFPPRQILGLIRFGSLVLLGGSVRGHPGGPVVFWGIPRSASPIVMGAVVGGFFGFLRGSFSSSGVFGLSPHRWVRYPGLSFILIRLTIEAVCW